MKRSLLKTPSCIRIHKNATILETFTLSPMHLPSVPKFVWLHSPSDSDNPCLGTRVNHVRIPALWHRLVYSPCGNILALVVLVCRLTLKPSSPEFTNQFCFGYGIQFCLRIAQTLLAISNRAFFFLVHTLEMTNESGYLPLFVCGWTEADRRCQDGWVAEDSRQDAWMLYKCVFPKHRRVQAVDG